MATANEIISKAFRLFDEETDSKYEQNGNRYTALEILNDGYFDICIETQCSRTSGTITTVSGTREYNQPAGCVGVLSVYCADEYRFLNPTFYNEDNILVNQPGTIYKYYLTPDKIGFDVIPNQTYTLTIDYLTGPTADLELTDEPSLIPAIWQNRILPYYILYKLFAIDKREDISARAPLWKLAYEEKLNKMRSFFAGEKMHAGALPEME